MRHSFQLIGLGIILSLFVIALRDSMHWPRLTAYAMVLMFCLGRISTRILEVKP